MSYSFIVLLVTLIPLVLRAIFVVPSQPDHTVRNEIIPRPVAVRDSRHRVLSNFCVICQQLLDVFRQAVAVVSEGRIVIVRPDTRVETNALNDLLCVQPFALCVGIEFIEIRNCRAR